MSKVFRAAGPGAVLAFLAFFIVVPLLTIFVTSLNPSDGAAADVGIFDNYRRLLEADWLWSTLFNTFAVALGCMIIAFVLGTPLAWLAARTDLPARNLLTFLCISPLFLSPLLSAVAWEIVSAPSIGIVEFLTLGLIDFHPTISGFWGCALIMGFYFSSYVFLYLYAAYGNVDPAVEEAAAIAGVGPIGTFWRITTPIIAPAIVFVGVLILILAIGFFSIPAVLGWPHGFMVVSARIFFLLASAPIDWGVASALAVTLLPVVFLGVLMQRYLVRRGDFTLVTGKTSRNLRIPLGRWRWIATAAILFYWLVVAALPTMVILVVSLSPYAGGYDALGVGQYLGLFADDLFLVALHNSMVSGVTAATIAVALSILFSYLVLRVRRRWTMAAEYLISLPLAIPGVILSVALLWMWLALPVKTLIYSSLAIIVVACVTQFLTSGVRAVSAVMVQVGTDVEEAAWVAGAGRSRTVLQILVPIMGSGLQSAWILLFILCFRELSAVVFIWSSKTITLPLLTFEVWREGSYPHLAAIGMVETVVIALTVAAFQLAGLALRRIAQWRLAVEQSAELARIAPATATA